ncbi:uncharacterized protein LOC144126110 [Amblyomma americanum]
MAPPGRSRSPTTPTTPPFVIMAPPRDPGTFSGTDGSDIEDWISLYERVSNYNRWDPTLMLANVIFYLNGTARVWYETHEEELTSWNTFKQKLKTLFGRPDDRQLAAKKQLATRAQSSTESYVAYIQDILALCHKVDAATSETDKVGHVLKGIADDAFHLLVCKDCTSIDSIINECRRFEQVKGRRISPSFARLPNMAATSSCEDHRSPSRTPSDAPAVTDSVTRIVRRELQAQAPVISPPSVPDTTLPAVSLIQAVVHVGHGSYVPVAAWNRLLALGSESTFCKQLAVCLWGNETLAQRSLTDRLGQITWLTLGNKTFAMTAYVNAPDDSCKGAINNVPTNNTPTGGIRRSN